MDTNVKSEAEAPVAQPQPQGLPETLKQEWRRLAIGLSLAIVVAAVVIGYQAHTRSSIESAARMLDQAKNSQHLAAILDQYPSTPAAQVALLTLAKSQYDSGDYVQAKSSYAKFEQQFAKHPLIAVAQLGQIHCTEAMGQTAETLGAFTAFASNHVDSFLLPEALFGEARCLERLGRRAEAKAIYEDFLAAHPKSPWQTDVEEALKILDREMRKPVVRL